MGIKPLSLTTLAKGTNFENRTIAILRAHLSISCRHVGGRGDGGIDLIGWWWLPPECMAHPRSAHQDAPKIIENTPVRTPLRVFAQCKAEEKKIGPRYVREFEGTILRSCLTPGESDGAVTSLSRNAAVGVFSSTSPFTKASLLQAYSSPLPLVLMYLPDTHEPVSNVVSGGSPMGALVFNPSLNGKNGVLRETVEARWERPLDSGEGRPGLWYDGRPLTSWTPDDSIEGLTKELD